jgi:DNA mismatch endonuclease (patch repair protein)
MRGNKKIDTKPETRLRSALHHRGLRFRKHLRIEVASGVRVTPDVAFPKQQVAVFVDGCFWHRCPEHGTSPGTNRAYWQMKLDRNVERDERVNAALEAAGWTVLRVWEHIPPEEGADVIANALVRRCSELAQTSAQARDAELPRQR